MAKKSKSGADKTPYIWAMLRVAIGLIFLWAFFDKFVGLGYSTCRTVDPATKTESVKVLCTKAVAKGGSPTAGYLKNSPKGPLKETYNNMAGNHLVDFLFMAGLGLVGLALVLGVGVKVAAVSGSLILLMMWSAVLPPANHPVLDDHIVYALVLWGVMASNSTQVWGLGKWWARQDIVKKFPILA